MFLSGRAVPSVTNHACALSRFSTDSNEWPRILQLENPQVEGNHKNTAAAMLRTPDKSDPLRLTDQGYCEELSNCDDGLSLREILQEEIRNLIQAVDCFFEAVPAALSKYSRTQFLNSCIIVFDGHFSLDERRG